MSFNASCSLWTAALLVAGIAGSYVAFAACPNVKADRKQQTQCRNCEQWNDENQGETCEYTEAPATIYAACWDATAKGKETYVSQPATYANGTGTTKSGTCDHGVCASAVATNTFQVSGTILSTRNCNKQ
jgi:hypothetical protein